MNPKFNGPIWFLASRNQLPLDISGSMEEHVESSEAEESEQELPPAPKVAKKTKRSPTKSQLIEVFFRSCFAYITRCVLQAITPEFFTSETPAVCSCSCSFPVSQEEDDEPGRHSQAAPPGKRSASSSFQRRLEGKEATPVKKTRK